MVTASPAISPILSHGFNCASQASWPPSARYGPFLRSVLRAGGHKRKNSTNDTNGKTAGVLLSEAKPEQKPARSQKRAGPSSWRARQPIIIAPAQKNAL